MKATLMTIWIISLASFGFAQDSIQQRPESFLVTKVTIDPLKLSHDQARRWREVREKYGKGDVSNIDEVRRTMIKELLSTLTKDQLKKFKKIIQAK